jgi:peroxiredoxin Q/BCP
VTLEAGDRAPDFLLPSTGGDLRLSDYWGRGKLILAFYTEDNTPLCASQLSTLRDDYDVVKEQGADIVAVSADSIESHTDFAERSGGLPFALASDTSLEAARAYGVAGEDEKRSLRAVFVIDHGGTILHAERWFQPGNTGQYEAIFRALGVDV